MAAVSAVSLLVVAGVVAAYTTRVRTQADQLSVLVRDLRQRGYATDLELAFDAWQVDDARAMRTRLDTYRTQSELQSLRTLPWYLLASRYDTAWRTLRDHDGEHFSIAYSPDGRHLASGGDDGMVRIWNRSTGRVRHRSKGHASAISDVAYSADGKFVASVGEDGYLARWRLANLDEAPQRYQGSDGEISAVTFSPDSRWIAFGGVDARITLCRSEDLSVAWSSAEPSGAVNSLAFSHDGRWLASGDSTGNIVLWDPAEGSIVRRVTDRSPVGRINRITGIAFTKDGRALMSGSPVFPRSGFSM